MNIQDYEFKAKLQGKSITDIPEDLFIPPDALTIILEEFEGPLDLLLYLIKKQNIDIVDIPIFPITEQYIEYINMMEKMQFELASDYLVMASTLTEIKSRMLIPTDDEDEEEDDPRADLIKRLLEYQKYKNLSEEIDEIPRVNRDTYIVSGIMTHFKHTQKMPTIEIEELEKAFQEVLKRAEIFASHNIETEQLSVRERMSMILDTLNSKDMLSFIDCFNFREGRMGVIVTFLAILELVKESLIDIIQNDNFSMIYLQSKTTKE
ncbi:MAG: segregation/condensation protein A [Gammaproteobacteria bacterium]|nr:segregation/condensation protein A [Gammaproteobacteria bacterium]|tara:strand:+ start:5033 stop:5824 length:792 start_codon:yes stop_codon:yes gene_type:complete